MGYWPPLPATIHIKHPRRSSTIANPFAKPVTAASLLMFICHLLSSKYCESHWTEFCVIILLNILLQIYIVQILIAFARQCTHCRKKSTHIYVTVKMISVRH